jgi:HNH endonuclease
MRNSNGQSGIPEFHSGSISRTRVFVELVGDKIVRIFRNGRGAVVMSQAYDEGRVIEFPRKDAVEAIRRQVFERSNKECEHCGKAITWGTLHMHEKQPKGKSGEVSLDNSIALCYNCHIGREDSAHGNRRPRFGEQIS